MRSEIDHPAEVRAECCQELPGMAMANSKGPSTITSMMYNMITEELLMFFTTAATEAAYFHNWTCNRVTCRDWFQVSLKEDLTVLRCHEFSSDM
ncbi:hypothetical protein L1987_07978 [Smallanthus sonchifolius]|uniref:Uncharacterized protein n=1 Tax=Smallanthus sonchifolius TaxID=185202 RepID=A0ACB9JJU1_9ASTR|nr:hypothetical protein L1987_07978 [Smallanthus sonchifolius]